MPQIKYLDRSARRALAIRVAAGELAYHDSTCVDCFEKRWLACGEGERLAKRLRALHRDLHREEGIS